MAFVDDKSPICIPFILDLLHKHRAVDPTKPFFIGLNGVQGVGKTTLVKALATTLRKDEGLEVVVVSIDEFYLPRSRQAALAESQPDNALLQVRGQPGTHDIDLAVEFLKAVVEGKPTKLPVYDKSAFSGKGDRVDPSQWESIHGPGQKKVEVVILEGWCVGFRPLDQVALQNRLKEPSRTLQRHKPEHLSTINDSLRKYNRVTDMLHAFIYLAAERTEYVYNWRRQQEEMLRREKGTGMTDEEVEKFVDAYYPSYELYSDKLRDGLFAKNEAQAGRQLTIVVAEDRTVKSTKTH